MIHGLELPIQAQDLIKAYQTSTYFYDIYHYITHNYVVVNNFLFRIDTQKDKDRDKGNLFLLVIPEKYEPIILHTYHDSLLSGHQGPYQTDYQTEFFHS